MFRFLPEAASEHAANVDWLHNLITDISVFFTVTIVGAMIYFAIKYRRRDGVDHDTPQIRGSHILEAIWTVVPTIICIIVGYYGLVYYDEARVVPKDSLTINVWAQKWYWNFEYDNGKQSKAELVIPVNRSVKLVMKSRDVLHSFFIPAMRVKKDVLPSEFVYLSFKAIKTGVYPTFCTEYCGTNHSAMLGTLRVVSQAEYDHWVNDRSAEIALMRQGPAEKGKALYTAKGCNACHSLDGSKIIGPSFLKLFQRVEKLADGSEVECEENYLRESILNPNAKIVHGFQPNMMPAFAGQLNDDDVTALIAFIKAQDGSGLVAAPAAAPVDNTAALEAMTPAERGKKWYNEKTCMACHSLDGSKLTGPSFQGIFGRQEKLVDGSTVTADEAYLKESMLNPMAKVVEGYPPAMPPGLVNEAESNDLIEYLKTVK